MEVYWILGGDVMFYVNGQGNPTVPPASQIENPDPQAGTNNFYTQDGVLGGSFVNCFDTTQPGVAAITSYLNTLSYSLFNGASCASPAFYLSGNISPGAALLSY